MKIAFISRATLYSSPGGDTMQIDQTAAYLRKLGVKIDIILANQKINYSDYDLLHFFNIIRPADILGHITKSNTPFVVSTIFVDYSAYERKARSGWKGFIGRLLTDGQLEYVKTIVRWLKNGEKILSPGYLVHGHSRSIKLIARKASFLLPNSQNEYHRFVTKYHLDPLYHIVPNGIDHMIVEQPLSRIALYQNAVLCVGRIEGRKNQLNLIRSLNNTNYNLFIIGKPSPNNIRYYEKCKKEASANIHFLDWQTGKALYNIYQSAKVHVLPSYFETTGLSSLEAAFMGCNIVVTPYGDTRDYFKDYAWYCDPDDIKSIRQAVDAAFDAPFNQELKKHIMANYTWEQAAKETLYAYKQVLNKNPFICNKTP